jgi:ribosome-associated toxin RatA of RatAB toxin-antitoxin module
MREIRRSALVPVPPQRMFELINDIEHYPQFVPGCHAAEVLERRSDLVRAAHGGRRRAAHFVHHAQSTRTASAYSDGSRRRAIP